MTLKCPKCKSSWKFAVEVVTTYTIDAYEHTLDSNCDFYWDDNSTMTCKTCGHDATVREFRGKNEVQS